jgi:hypothetical protein
LHKLLQQLEPLGHEFDPDIRDAREVPSWSAQAGDKTLSDWLADLGKNDGIVAVASFAA